jgi:hypothetical protein
VDRLIDAGQIADWIPARVSWQEEEPLIDWCYLGEQRMSEANFDQTLNKCIELPFNLLFRHQTTMEVLRRVDEARPGMRPTGLIFHSSRSGSRLLMRMLAGLPANTCLSEARPLDSLLRARRLDPSVTDAQRVEWVRLMVSCLARPSRGGERHLFIKFHQWSIFELRIIRLAFPDVPWIFVYRDPIEELVSQMAQRDAHMIPGVIDPQIFGMDHLTISEMAPEDYCARVLAALYGAGLMQHGNGGMLINDRQLPEAVWSISGYFGLSCSEAEKETMMGIAKLQSTNPAVSSAGNPGKANERIREAADRWLYPLYEELESARMQTGV